MMFFTHDDSRCRALLAICALAYGALSSLFAQQEPQYTQFMFNKLSYNPGYAGSFVSPTLTAIYRGQWFGIEGAPNSQLLSYTQPLLNERLGIGLAASRFSVGITRALTIDLVYSYRVPMRRGHLGIGLQPSVRNFWQNWNDERLYSATPATIDVSIPTGLRSKWLVNFGFGLYYSNDERGWYVGAAVPRFLQNNIDFSEFGTELSREERHFNAMGGFTLRVDEGWEIIPQALLRYVPRAPFSAEVNVMAGLRRKFYGGLTYRSGGDVGYGESLDILAGIQVTKNLFFCASYDIGLTRLQRLSTGAVEATARWWFNPPEGTIIDSGLGF
ncbi:MAG: type IX secretion system membrane protein PorP/SprF [Saprospiraceae bacterium]|nr:type IX secretion system membrane protein PorP/SprF [Saprospiraceae bacterium]